MGRRANTRTKRRASATNAAHWMVEQLEPRVLLSVVSQIPTWTEMVQGPITGSATGATIAPDNPTAGAVEALATPPYNSQILFAGTVDGGVWRSTTATSIVPEWTPLTDQMPSLSIGAVALGHFDSDGNLITASTPSSLLYNKLVVYAGTADFSNGGPPIGGALTGLIMSRDGGDHWTPIGGDTLNGLDIVSIVPSLTDPNTILVAAQSPDSNNPLPKAGVWLSTDGGKDFKQVFAGEATDLIVDPGTGAPNNPIQYYVAVRATGFHQPAEIYDATNPLGPLNWTPVNTTNLAGLDTTGRIKMSVHDDASTDVVYAALIGNSGHTMGVYRSTDPTKAWSLIQSSPDVDPGGQGLTNFSIVADPNSPNVVFIAGDRSVGASPNIQRADINATPVWTPVYTAGTNAPHPDSRDMVFNADGDIVESDDGGIYRLKAPNNPGPTWDSLNGTYNLNPLHVSEFWSAAYDTANGLLFGGVQDIGDVNQQGDGTWTGLPSGDGTLVQVDNSVAGQSTRYLADNNLSNFVKQTFDSNGTALGGNGPLPLAINNAAGFTLNGNNGTMAFEARNARPFVTQYAIEHDKDASGNDRVRMLIGTDYLYESFDGGQTLFSLSGLNAAGTGPQGSGLGDVTAMAYGGSFNGVAAPDVAYVAATQLWVRTSLANPNLPQLSDFQVRLNYPGKAIKDIVLDPTDWHKGYVVDVTGAVWKFVNTGLNAGDWTAITGNLNRLTNNVDSVEVLSGPNVPGGLALLVGGLGGVFVTFNPSSGSLWAKAGRGMPNLYVTDVRYDAPTDTLTAATMGRGVWMIKHYITNMFSSAAPALGQLTPSTSAQAANAGVLELIGDDQTDKNDTFRLVLDAANPGMLDVFDNNNTQTPDLTIDAASVEKVAVTGGSGTNTLIVDDSNGLVSFINGITLDASTTRQDINETPIDSSVVSEIRSGLQAMATWAGTLAQLGALAQQIPGLGISLAQTFAIGDGSNPISGVFQQGLVAQINNYFNSDASPTIQELVAFLQSLSQPLGKVSFGIDPASVSGGLFTNSSGNQDLRFDLTIHLAGGSTNLPLNFSQALSSLGVSFTSSGTLNLSTSLDLDMSFGVDLAPGLSAGDAFFIKINSLSASAQVSAGTLSPAGGDGSKDSGEDDGGDPDGGADSGQRSDVPINADLKVGFLDAKIVNGALNLDANVQVKVNNPDPDGHITMNELTGSTIASLLSLDAEGSLNAQFPIQVSIAGFNPPATPLIKITSDDLFGSAPQVTTENFDQLLNFDNGAALLSLGIDQLVSALASMAKSNSLLQKKIPLLNKSIDDVVNFPQFFQNSLSSATTQVANAAGVLQAPFQDSDQLLSILQGLAGSTASVSASGTQIIYTLHLHGTTSTTIPLSLDLGSALHLGVNAQLAFNVGIDTNVSFGVDGSTQQFFIVASGQPVVQLTANLSATVNGSASLGFLSVAINNGTVIGTGTGSLTLIDPQTDSPPTPGIITGSELAASNLSSLVSINFSGSASASIPLSTTVPGISPATLSISWPDLTDPSSINIDTTGLDQFMGFNGLTFDSVLGYLKQLPALLGHLSDSGILKSIGFLGSSVSTAAQLGQRLSDALAPLDNANINTIQDLQNLLNQQLTEAGAGALLNVSASDIDFTLNFGKTFSGSTGWSIAQSIGGGLLSLQTTGTLPLSASFNAGLELGISLTPTSNPLDDVYVIEGPASQISGSFSVNATGLTATATVGYLATVGVSNGTATVNGAISLPLGSGPAGTHLTLTQLLADPAQLFGSPQITGTANVNLPLTGLPGQGSNPHVGLSWTDVTDPSTLTVDTSSINFSALNPLANFDSSSVLGSIGSIISLIQQWGGLSVMNTNIPLINEPISKVLDFATEAENIFQTIQSASVSTPSDFNTAVLNAPQNAPEHFSTADVQIIAGALNNPSQQVFDYHLQFHQTLSTSIAFDFGPGFLTVNGNMNVAATFTTDIEFGYSAADGFYIIGNADPAHPAVSLSATLSGNFDRIGGTVGPLVYGISNGTASATFDLGLNLVPADASNSKITGAELVENAASILKPSISGSANLMLPMGMTLGTDGPGMTTTFSASWNPARAQPFEFGPNNSDDISDGFTSINYDIGEFVNKIIGPVLQDIKQYNPIPQSVLDTLNKPLPIINESAADILGDFVDNPGVKLLFQIDSAINAIPTSGAESINLSSYFPAGQMPDVGDAGGPNGGVPPAGNPNGDPTSGNFGAFKSFTNFLKSNLYLSLPVLDDPSGSIIKILTGKTVNLVEFNPGQVDITATYETPKVFFPLYDLGFADVTAYFSAGLSVDLFANIDIGLSTRGIIGNYIVGNQLQTHQSSKLLDGLFINDSAQYQAGISLSGHVTIGGEVDILGLDGADLSGTVGVYGQFGVHVNDVAYNHDGSVQGAANYAGDGPGDNQVYLDEISWLANNMGAQCAIMPEGELGLTLSASVSALGGLIQKQLISEKIPLASYNTPCVATETTLAQIQGNSLVMIPDSDTAGATISVSIVEDPTTGKAQFLRILKSNSSEALFQEFALTDLTAAGVNTIVLEGTNGDDEFSIDPAVTQAGGIHNLQIHTGDGNDHVNLGELTSSNSTITGETITAGNGNDTIVGNYAPEVITLGSGTNSVLLGTANDSVTATSGTDTIAGSNGNDTVTAGSGNDLILLGNGNNLVQGGSGLMTLNVGHGKNVIVGGAANLTVTTGDGDNKIYASTTTSSITVGAGQNIIYGTSGNTTITAGGGNDFISLGTGTNSVDGGSGNTTLLIVANANQTLANNAVDLGASGKTTFSNISSLSLTGGSGNNVFDVSGWTGNPVQINGGGGSDTILSSNNTDFTLTDASLARSDGAIFALNGIGSAALSTISADAKFDVTGWYGGGTLTGGIGLNTLVAGNLTTATLTNSSFQRTGAVTVTLSNIRRAVLSGVLTGSAHIEASAFSGTVALYGQGNNNTLIGGSGSDYISGGNGTGNVLTGNGPQDNQIIGGSGSSNTIHGGPGSNLLVGSSGGFDVITVGAGFNHVYTPGGHETINAQTGNAIVYLTGSGNTVNIGSSTTDQVVHSGDPGTNPADFTAPAPNLGSLPQPPINPANTLPTGTASQGQWVEYASSASGGGLSNSTGLAIEPSIVATGSGAGSVETVAWADNRDGVYEIYVARYSGGSWQELAGSAHGLGISNSTVDSRRPSIALDGSGNPIVTWTEINGASTNIYAAKYDPTVNGGLGGWVALGTSMSAGGLSNTGHGDNARILQVSGGPVVAWLDNSSGHANVYVSQFNGSSWAALGSGAASGTGITGSGVDVPGFSLATGGSNVVIAWTQPGTGAGNSVYVKQYSGSAWNAVGTSASGNGISGANSSSMPSVAYQGTSIYVAWAGIINGTSNVAAASYNGSAWSAVSIDTPASAGANQVSRGAATHPVLSADGSALDLVWFEDRLTSSPNQAVAIYATRLNGGSFIRQLPGDASFDGVFHRSTSLSNPTSLALAVDGAGHPFVVWGDSSSGSSQVYMLGDTLDVQKIIYVNDGLTVADSYTTAAGASTNNGLTPATPLDTIQAALNLTITPGTVILVDGGTQAGFTATSADNGVLIIGSSGAPTIVSSDTELDGASNVTVQGLQLTGGLTVSGGSNNELVRNTGGSVAQVSSDAAGSITIESTSGVTLEHNTVAGLILDGTTSGVSVRYNVILNQGILVTAPATGLFVHGNQARSLSLNAASQGTITGNHISGGGLTIGTVFTGSIDHNVISNSPIGVIMAASAPLSSNVIINNAIGIVDWVASATTGLGFLADATPNQIINNGVGVLLTGLMQGQYIVSNTIGVTGSGVLGGTSLDSANLIEGNTTGASFTGEIRFNRFGHNGQSIVVQNGQLIDHNAFYDNTSTNIETVGTHGVRIINNSFFSTSGKNVLVDGGSSDIQVLNNIMWAQGDTDLYVADDSRVGFFSDYNDLFTSGTGKIVHYLVDFQDILDWQQALNQFDLHSIGTTSVNPTGAQPQFVDASLGDFRVLPAAAGLRRTSPTTGTADQATDLALPSSYQNLLTNPSFESGVTGWTVSAGGTTQANNPPAFNGVNYFFAGSIASGFAEQTVNLLAAGYTAAQLDSQTLNIAVGGRIRSAAESPADQGSIVLTFLDANGVAIGSSTTLIASNASDRWELVSAALHVPVGTRGVKFHFISLRQSGSTDDSYLDAAFLYVLPDTTASDMGAYGNTVASAVAIANQAIHVQSPDLYVNWTVNQPHQILWNTIGNAGGSPVRIDLYQDSGGVPQFLLNIAASVPDNGSFTWIPANSGVSANTFGLRIVVSLVNSAAISDRSAETFAIPPTGTQFYVNDGSTTGDQYTTAAGNNRATGMSPSSPLPMLTTLLRTYTINSGNIIYIDNGAYNTFRPAVFSSQASLGTGAGATLQGPTNNGTSASITAIGYSNDGVIDVNSANSVTLRNVTTSGGEYGLWVLGGSQNLTASSVTATGAVQDGVRIESNSTGTALDHVTSGNNGHDGVFIGSSATTLSFLTTNNNAGDGVFIGGNFTSISHSTADNNAADGFDLSNAGAATVTTSEASGDQIGLNVNNSTSSTTTVIGNTNLAGAQGNIFHNNVLQGIIASIGNGVSIVGNTVYGQSGSNGIGINVGFNALVSDNVVWGNQIGIAATSDSIPISNNRVFDNSVAGITLSGVTATQGNVIYSNGIGIKASNATGALAQNDLIYANTTAGILVSNSGSAQLTNNTIYQITGDAIDVSGTSSSVSLRNNILWTVGGYDINISSQSESGFQSDYNLFYVTGTGQIGFWENAARSSLALWRLATTADADSLFAQPLFVNVVNASLGYVGGVDHGATDDFHDQSTGGSFHGGALAPIINMGTGLPIFPTATLTTDASESPAVDHGDPTSAFASEPAPNGGFINIGAYGNTSQASESPNPYVLILIPNGGEAALAGQNYTIRWRSEDNAGNVSIDLLQGTSPQTATVVSNIVTAAPNSGQYVWAIPSGITPASNYFIRVTRNGTPSAVAISASAFTIKGPVTSFYINDGTLNGSGDLTTAIGNDANDGLSPATPKASLQSLLQTYTLGAGDTVYVDTGTYNLAGNIVIPAADSGLTIAGNASAPTILNRGNTSSGSYVFDVQGATNVTLEHLTITGASVGINVSNGVGSSGLTISNNIISNDTADGVYVGSGNNGALITGNQVFGQTILSSNNAGIFVNGSQAAVSNNQVYGNMGLGILVQNGSNSTISGNTVYNDYEGISADTSAVSANVAHDNQNIGIITSGNSPISGNTVYNNTSNSGIGIQPSGGGVSGNVVYGNRYGIDAYAVNGQSVTTNLVYSNSTAGIYFGGNGDSITGNVVYGNGWGIIAFADSTTISNNLAYNNVTGAIDVQGNSNDPSRVLNNTMYQPTGDGLRIDSNSAQLTVRDNIIWTQNGFDLNVNSSVTPQSLGVDYNDLYITGSGEIGQWQGISEGTLFAWQSASLGDANSLSVDPLFVNVGAADFHEQSQYGSYHGGSLAVVLNGVTGLPANAPAPTLTMDAATSPALDRGSLADSYANEIAPNGAAVNLGVYGNTNQASLSPSTYLLVIHPNGGETWSTKQFFKIIWHDDQLGRTGAQTVKIDLLQGANVTNIITGLTDTGSYNWLIPASTAAGTNYSIRVTETGTSSAIDTSDGNFSIVQGTGTYYVNDGTVNAGDITTAPGNDANDGLTPATPKATIQSVLSSYTFSPGDVIQLDAGTYSVTSNIMLIAADSGITIQGPGAVLQGRVASIINADSPTAYYRFGDASGTVATDSSGNGNNATYVGGVGLGLTGFFPGDPGTSANLSGYGQYVQLPGGFANFSGGFSFEVWINPSSTVSNETLFDLGSGVNGAGNELSFGRQGTTGSVVLGGSYGSVVAPNALINGIWQELAVTISGSGAVTIYRNGASLATGTITLPTNITRTSNYIARSNGAASAYFSGEMQEASFYSTALSATQITNHFNSDPRATLNRGNTSAGDVDFQFDGASNLKLKYLILTGGYSAVSSTSGVPSNGDTLDHIYSASNAHFGLDFTSGNIDSLTLSNSTVVASGSFGINIGAINNPNIINNAIFSNASDGADIAASGGLISGNLIASNGGNGLSVSASGAGAQITISNNVVHDNASDGIFGGPSTVITGNTVYNQRSTNYYGIYGQGQVRNNVVYENGNGLFANGVTVTGNRVFANVAVGIATLNSGSAIGNVIYSNGTWGIQAGNGNGGNYGTIANNLIYANGSGAFDATTTVDAKFLNNTIYQPAGDAIRLQGGTNSSPVLIRNNIIDVGSGNAYNIDDTALPGVSADYNDIYITGAGNVGVVAGNVYNAHVDWIYETGGDLHTIWVDPQLSNPAGSDGIVGFSGGIDHGTDDNFHVQSTSPTIDAGLPVPDLIAEPTPNGVRNNLGYEGASSSATASPVTTLQVIAPTSLEKLQSGTAYTIQWMSSGLLANQTLTEDHVGGAAVGNWNAAEYIVGTPNTTAISGAINTSGVTDPAPQAVYQNYERALGNGTSLVYSIPVVDGTYTLRLDLVDPGDNGTIGHHFNVVVQGQTMVSNYDPYVAAGGALKATSLSYTVTASGGTGISVQLVSTDFWGAVLSGLRVSQAFAGGAASQTASVQVSTDNGSTWNTIATNQAFDSEGRGSLIWTPSTPTNGATALVRVIANNGANTTSAPAGPFLIAPSGNTYYVNGSATGGSITSVGGSDANDGKSPATPMASIQAVLNAYHPGAGQIIRVDSATYNLNGNLILTPTNSGLTIQGPSDSSAILNRGNTSSGTVFDLQGVTNLTLDHLSMTGAYFGVYGTFTSSTGTTISNSSIYGIYEYGISAATNSPTNWTITGNSIHDINGPAGTGISFLFVNSDTITGNTIFNNASAGITIYANAGVTVSGNTVYSNGYGMYGSGGITMSGNTVYGNATYGIEAWNGALAVGNTVYKQTASNGAGIQVASSSEARGNVVYANFVGIVTNNGATIDRNKVYSNTGTGISVPNGPVQLIDNLVYANSGPGIALASTSGTPTIIGNTVYQAVADAVRLTSSPNVTVRNNILWTQTGYDLNLDAGSQTGFVSDYNDLYVSGAAKAGLWGGAAQATLANWQTASSQDAHSISANPNFVDIDGADNILGYNPAGAGTNGGADDNFYLSAGSPAIDSGYSWAGYLNDIEGFTRIDDPGTTNTGSGDYSPASTGSNQFVSNSGTAQNFHYGSSPQQLIYTLPFAFPFYGTIYTTAHISDTGVIRLGPNLGSDPAVSTNYTEATLLAAPMIAPLWGNSQTGATGDIYIDTSVTNQVTIRWVLTNLSNSTTENFAAVLFSNGQIRFDYGSGNTGLAPVVGVAEGDGMHDKLASYNGQPTLTNANSLLFTTPPGFVDIGAYEFHGNSSINTPPTVVATTPTAIASSSATTPISQIGLTFSTAMNSVDMLAASDFLLVGAGPDGMLGTSDDNTFAVTPQYTSGSSQVNLLISGGALPVGTYSLTVLSTPSGGVHDVSGNLLDGDGNGSAGGNYVRTFTIAVPSLDVISGTPGVDQITLMQASDHTDIDWTLNGGPVYQLPVTDPNGLTINGNGGNDVITLVGSNPLPAALHLNGTFTINGLNGSNPLANTTLEIGRSTVYISYSAPADPIVAIQGYLKNGYNNGLWNGAPTASTGVITSIPAAQNAAQTTAIGYADSADGLIAGQPANTIELKYTLYGDTGLRASVGFNDFTRLTQHYNQTAGATWDTGDFNFDTSVNFADFTLMTRTYNTGLGNQAMPAAGAAISATAGASAAPTAATPSGNAAKVTALSLPITPPRVPIDSNVNSAKSPRRRTISIAVKSLSAAQKSKPAHKSVFSHVAIRPKGPSDERW